MQTRPFTLAGLDSLLSNLKTPQCFLHSSPLGDLKASSVFAILRFSSALMQSHFVVHPRKVTLPKPRDPVSWIQSATTSHTLYFSPLVLFHQPNRRLCMEVNVGRCVACPEMSEMAYEGSKFPIPGGIQTEGSRFIRDPGFNTLTLFEVGLNDHECSSDSEILSKWEQQIPKIL